MINRIAIIEEDGTRKFIGEYCDEKNVFTSKRNSKKHLLKKHDAWCLDHKVLHSFLVLKDADIILTDERGKQYRVSAKKFLDKGTHIKYNQHREQVFLPRSEFTILTK